MEDVDVSKNLVQEVEDQRHEVVVDSYAQMWSELLNLYKAGDIEIDPLYQRGFRWTLDQQTRYIESLLLNIPTPPIFLAEKVNGAFEVIDGLQRFSTIIKFFCEELKSEAPLNEVVGAPAENNLNIPTVLTHAPILGGLERLSRATMPDTLVRTLRYARVQVILLKKESSPLAKFNVFTRLNRSGTTLSNQEIRNCSARLTESKFPDELMKLASEEHIAKALNMSRKDSASMGIQESILRLIAFGNHKPTTAKLEDFLDETMYKISLGVVKFTSKERSKVSDVFKIIYASFPEGEAFRFRKGGKFAGSFSPNLFDIVAVGVYKNLAKCKKLPPADFKQRVIDLHNQVEAINLTGAGSNARSKMIGRVEYGTKWFA